MVHEEVGGVQAQSDGSVRVIESRQGRTGGARITIRRLDPAGATQAPVVFVDPDPRTSYATAALRPDGGAVVIVTKGDDDLAPGEPSSNDIAYAVDVSPTGAASAPQAITRPGTLLVPDGPPEVGPTGAVAVLIYDQVLFRPAGSTAFLPPIELGRPGESDTGYSVAMAPDGGAAVISNPFDAARRRPWVRRISPQGLAGPRIDVPIERRRDYGADLEFASNGDLSIAVHLGWESNKRPALRFTRLRAGAQAVEPIQRLPAAVGGAGDRVFAFDMAITPGGTTGLLVGREPDGLRFFAGTGVLARVKSFETRHPESGWLTARADGGFTALWDEDTRTGSRIVATTSPSTLKFTRPHEVSLPTSGKVVSLYDGALLVDGRVGLVYSEFGKRDRTLGTIVRP